MVAPILRFSIHTPVPDEPGQRDHVSVEPANKTQQMAFLNSPPVVAGTVIGLTLFAVAASVMMSRKPPLERQLIKLVNRLFPIGPRREWLLTGYPRYAYLPHLPTLTPDLAHLSSSSNPLNQRGIDAIGAAWYRALQHRYNNSTNLLRMARDPQFIDDLMPMVRQDHRNLKDLMTLYRRLEAEGVVFSETQTIDLDAAFEILDSIS